MVGGLYSYNIYHFTAPCQVFRDLFGWHYKQCSHQYAMYPLLSPSPLTPKQKFSVTSVGVIFNQCFENFGKFAL